MAVQEYMETMKDEDEQGYQKLYSGYIAAGVEPDDMEEMYTEAHKKIRENPTKEKKAPSMAKPTRKGNKVTDAKGTTWTRKLRLNHKDRKARVAQKIANAPCLSGLLSLLSGGACELQGVHRLSGRRHRTCHVF